MIEHGSRGDPASTVEAELVGTAIDRRLADSTLQWVELAKRIGVHALVAIFDEFGGEKIHIPSRRAFFEALYRPIRDARIHALRAQGLSCVEIAGQVGVTEMRVSQVLKNPPDDSFPES